MLHLCIHSCVRYNYDMQERSVMVDATFMIKSLAAMVRRAEVTIAPLLRMHVHGTCQQLVQVMQQQLVHVLVTMRNRVYTHSLMFPPPKK